MLGHLPYRVTVFFFSLFSGATERDPPIQEVVDCGVVPKLVQFLSLDQHPILQFEAAWALTNIASGTNQHTKAVIDAGAVVELIKLLRSTNADVREQVHHRAYPFVPHSLCPLLKLVVEIGCRHWQAVWGLGNIAGDSPAYRDLVLRRNALAPLVRKFSTDSRTPHSSPTAIHNTS